MVDFVPALRQQALIAAVEVGRGSALNRMEYGEEGDAILDEE